MPYIRRLVSTNQYINNMMDILRVKYEVVRIEEISTDIKKIMQVKAIFLNWIEDQLPLDTKYRLILYKCLGVKIIWVFHNRAPHDKSDVVGMRNMKWLARISDYIVCHSKDSIRYFPAKWFQRKCRYIPHPYYEIPHMIGKLDEKREDKDIFTFGLIGFIRPFKNIELLIRAFLELDLPHAGLLIVGNVEASNKEYAQSLKDMCSGCKDIVIEFKFIAEQKMKDELDKIDILVLPYNKKSSMNSGAMILALSFGKPVIIPDISMAVDMQDQEFVYMYHYETEKEHLENLKYCMRIAVERGKKKNEEIGKGAIEYLKVYNEKDKILEGLKTVGL